MKSPPVPQVARNPDVLIIGAGPAGLALGRELSLRGVRFLIVEQGAAPGESWRRMPPGLRLLSPWKSNLLRGGSLRRFPRCYAASAEEFSTYLQDYASHLGLSILTDTMVRAVEIDFHGGFRVETARGGFHPRVVVNATGCFANPVRPEIAGARDCLIPRIHFADYRGVAQIKRSIGRDGGKVLIVGKRLSAGQVLLELVDAGVEVALSHRTPIRFGPGSPGWWFFYRLLPQIEWLQRHLPGNIARGSKAPMLGGRTRKLINSGIVGTYPNIARLDRDEVVFVDGQRLRADLILFATGFRPALAHLRSLPMSLDERTGQPALRGFESILVSQLFFLGLDGQRNFQSRFIRGIRQDAVVLAGLLEERLRRAPEPAPDPLAAPVPVQSSPAA